MTLTVICRDTSPAMVRALERELAEIDHEVIEDFYSAKGNYVVFLEKGSAFKPGSIQSSLAVFLDNYNDKRVVAISPIVDFDNVDVPLVPCVIGEYITWGRPSSSGVHPTRTMFLEGTVMRRSSANRVLNNLLADDMDPGVYFWSKSCRVLCNPDFVYYSPYEYDAHTMITDCHVPETASKAWKGEMIHQ